MRVLAVGKQEHVRAIMVLVYSREYFGTMASSVEQVAALIGDLQQCVQFGHVMR